MRWTLKESRAVGFVRGSSLAWHLADDPRDPGAQKVMFRIYIQRANEAGEGVVLCLDADGYAADYWYPTMLDAERAALEWFGVTRSDWSAPSDDLP